MCRDTLNNCVIGIFNFSDSTQKTIIDFEGLAGMYKEFQTNKEVNLTAQEGFELTPWGYTIFYNN